MARRDSFLLVATNRWQLLALVCLLISLIAGCGGSMSPEQKEAFMKLQAVGARVNFKEGGYEVDLSNTVVSDNDLVHLKKIEKLKTLDLRNTPVTDAGLEHIRSIETLEFIGLPRLTVTPEGAESLRKSLPNAEVMH